MIERNDSEVFGKFARVDATNESLRVSRVIPYDHPLVPSDTDTPVTDHWLLLSERTGLRTRRV
ncbi:hypothetical protein [Subtercola lobariae]|uniref:Uncharacterized protein n=1 Tax=Subtercola lobariae TaxID=1588641 RepID=A0A917B7Q0_9MICO|nr:hypothetical protein [Subtercola lobariae]GGF25778.1 hypothetical protein GCM10011399_19060 [Subtercola lobariae]